MLSLSLRSYNISVSKSQTKIGILGVGLFGGFTGVYRRCVQGMGKTKEWLIGLKQIGLEGFPQWFVPGVSWKTRCKTSFYMGKYYFIISIILL